jgi:hypothetical protein
MGYKNMQQVLNLNKNYVMHIEVSSAFIALDEVEPEDKIQGRILTICTFCTY